MTDDRWRISTLDATCLVLLATFQAYDRGIYLEPAEGPPIEARLLVGQDLPQQPPIQTQQEPVQQVLAEQAMSVDEHHAEVSNPPTAQQEAALQDAVRQVEAGREALKALEHIEEKTKEMLEQKDKLHEIGNQAPDPVNQAEVRPPPGQEGLSTLGPVEVYAGPYPVQDPRLTALDLKHAEDLHKLDATTKRMEEGLKSRYEGSPDLDGYLKSFGEMAEKQRESRLSEHAAERQQLLREVGADQQRMVNQQQQFTVPVPPPPMPPPPPPPPPIPPLTR